MPVAARATDHRMVAGATTIAGILVAQSRFVDFTVQLDQRSINSSSSPVAIPWVAPIINEDSIPRRAQIKRMLSGAVRQDGFYRCTWTFSYWTTSMLTHARFKFWSSGSALSAVVGIMGYDVEGVAMYLTGIADQPIPGEDMRPELGGWRDVKIKLHHLTVAT